MNTLKIQRVWSSLGQQRDSLSEEAYAVLTWALTMGGPIALADQAAWNLIRSECPQHFLDGHTWYSTGPNQFELDVETDETEREIANSTDKAIRYLSARELLVPHAEHPTFVRATDELDARFS